MKKQRKDAKGVIRLAILAVLAITLASTAFAANSAEKTAQAYYPYHNTPDVLVFSGVGVKNDKVSTSVFIALDKAQVYDDTGGYNLLPYKSFYLIADGKATQLKLTNAMLDKETQTLVAHFEGDGKDTTLVIKIHTMNYQQVILVSGTFDGYLLNMKMYNNENTYAIMPTAETTTVAKGTSQSGSGGQDFDSTVVKEAIAKTGRK